MRSARWRTRDGGSLGNPIDTSGELLDGTKVDGVGRASAGAAAAAGNFVGTVTEKLMTYALGPGPRLLRHAGGTCDRPRRGQPRLSISPRSSSASSTARRFKSGSRWCRISNPRGQDCGAIERGLRTGKDRRQTLTTDD